MDLATIERLIELVGRSAIAELEYERDGWRLRLAKGAARPPGVEGDGDPPLGGEADEAKSPTARATAPAGTQGSIHTVAAGLVGVFYRAPSPAEPPFVSVGDVVTEGQTLGMLEAMKTLNVVEADRAGRVVEILQQDGAAVEAGTALFTLAPAE